MLFVVTIAYRMLSVTRHHRDHSRSHNCWSHFRRVVTFSTSVHNIGEGKCRGGLGRAVRHTVGQAFLECTDAAPSLLDPCHLRRCLPLSLPTPRQLDWKPALTLFVVDIHILLLFSRTWGLRQWTATRRATHPLLIPLETEGCSAPRYHEGSTNIPCTQANYVRYEASDLRRRMRELEPCKWGQRVAAAEGRAHGGLQNLERIWVWLKLPRRKPMDLNIPHPRPYTALA